MDRIRRIVAATDFSQDAGYALARAALIAEEHGADLSVVHVLDASTLDALKSVLPEQPSIERDLLAASQRALADLAAGATARRGISVTTAVRIGRVLDELLAQSRSADLLALGAHGLNRVKDRILGTTAERIIGKCSAPILVSRRRAESRYASIIAAVDLSGYSAPVLQAAHRIAPRAAFHLLHAYDVPFEGKLWLAGVSKEAVESHRGDVRAEALHRIHDLIDAQLADRRVSLILERGAPARTILKSATRHGIDLVVVGKQGKSALAEFLLGSVTRHVVADVSCDVLVVPAA
jgi:nucleotide-binding universal stress UspA family protein